MDQIKKNLFWIILSVAVLGGLITWYVLLPDLDAAREAALQKSKDLQAAADAARKPNGLKTPIHVKAAAQYIKRLDDERKTLVESIAAWPDFSVRRLNARYTEAPPADPAIKFDAWMDTQRKRLSKKLADAGITYSQTDFDRWLFIGINTDADLSKRPVDINSPQSIRHRDFQLRILSIMDEIVDALVPRTGDMPIRKFETDPAKEEPADIARTGALALVSFAFHPPADTYKTDEKGYAEALKRSGWNRGTAPADAAYTGVAMPVSVSSVEVEFISHISAVPVITRKMEGSEKYFASISTLDFERVQPLYPGSPTDTKVQADYAKAVFNPMLNTHYGEGPVKAYVALEFYEFDKAKADKIDAPPAPPAPQKGPKAVPVVPAPH